jgi:hypothetical protein
MSTIPFEQIRAVSLAHAPRLLADWFPSGRIVGREFLVGNIYGDPGESLSINIDKGVGADFAGDYQFADLIDVRAAMLHGRDRVAAARELMTILGIATNGHDTSRHEPPRPEPPKPAQDPKNHGDVWLPMVPPPSGIQKPAKSEFDGYDQVYDYRDAEDRPLFYVRRNEAKDGHRKQFHPLTYGTRNGKTGWHAKHPNTPRPLYGLNRLASAPTATVIVCEGEKSAIAAQHLFPDYVCVTWPCGSKSVKDADLTPLLDRRIIIWPDNDALGHEAAAELKALLPHARVLTVDDLEPGYDAADVSPEDPDQWLTARLAGQPDKAPPGEGLPYRKLKPIGPANIPPRQWAYGKFLLFGSVAVLGAVDGGGKGAIAVAMMLATITGEPLLGEKIWRKGPVAIVTYEDDEDEWHRRIAAACLQYELDYTEILNSVHFIHKDDETKISFGTCNAAGKMIFPDSAGMIKTIKDQGIIMLVVDPFNHAHDGDDGNNNVLIAKVCGEVSRIAKATNSTIIVLHHLRKGSSGQADDLMGATSLRATFRSCRILIRMTDDVAEKMKIQDGAWRYIRIAGSKENYAPPPDKSTWYKLVSKSLGNTNVDSVYPDGDDMGVATTWEPRPMFEGMDATTLKAVFNALRDNPHGPSKQAKNTPWAGKALMDKGGRSDVEATKIVKAWLDSGTLEIGEYYHSESKNNVKKVILNEAVAAGIIAGLEVLNVPAE